MQGLGEFNIYCDESCHLEKDNSTVMGLGAIWFPAAKKDEIFLRIKEIKKKHGFNPWFEIKWNKVSIQKVEFYIDVINYFFDDDDLHFRSLIVPDKTKLNHEAFKQTHDDFYYKMYFDMLKIILNPQYSHNIYLDIKDTKSQKKVDNLQDYLRNSKYDYDQVIIKKIQQIRSHEVQALQLVDLLLGAIVYLNRGLQTSVAKQQLINRIKERSKYSLTNTTLPTESKMNLFIWKGDNNI